MWAVGDVNAPTITSVAATGNSREIKIGVQFQPDNGWSKNDITGYEWAVAGSNVWQYLPEGGGTVTSSTLADGAAATIKVRVNVRKGTDDKKSSAEATGGTVTPFGPPSIGKVTCTAGDQVGHITCSWGNASNGGREASLKVTYSGKEEPLNMNTTAKSFEVGEGGTGTLCATVTQTTDTETRTAHECGTGTAASYARSYSGFRGGSGKCVSGSCGSGPFTKVGLDLSGWPPNATVRCSGTYDNKNAWVTLQVDGNGNWRGVPGTQGLPGWTLGGQYIYYLVGNADNDFNGWFTCTQQ